MQNNAVRKLEQKVRSIEHSFRDEATTSKADRELSDSLTAQEILTAGQLPINSVLRRRIVGALLRDSKRKEKVKALEEKAKEEEWVSMKVAGGGKCVFTIMMTKEQADAERGSR